MKKLYFVIVLSLLLCGCFAKEIEKPIPSHTFYEQDNIEENDNDINTDSVDELINIEGNINYRNDIFFDWEHCKAGDIPTYHEIEENGELKREYIFFDSGYLFEKVDSNTNLMYLQSADHIEFFKDSNGEENQILGWFDYRLVINAYVYFLDQGNLIRSNLDGTDSEWLDFSCRNIKYKNEYLYFLYREEGQDNSKLYRMKLDGVGKEQLSNFHSNDFCLTEDGAVHLVEKGTSIFIIYEQLEDDDNVKILAEFTNERFHNYQIAGMIGDTIYLSVMYSRMITETDKVEIYACKNGELELVHISDDKSNTRKYKPFVHGEYIYYWTPEGIHELNPIDGGCELIAEGIYGFYTAP